MGGDKSAEQGEEDGCAHQAVEGWDQCAEGFLPVHEAPVHLVLLYPLSVTWIAHPRVKLTV